MVSLSRIRRAWANLELAIAGPPDWSEVGLSRERQPRPLLSDRAGLRFYLHNRLRLRIAADPGGAPAVDVQDAVLAQDMGWITESAPGRSV